VRIGVGYKSDHRIIRWTNCRRLIGSSIRSGGAGRKRFEKVRAALPETPNEGDGVDGESPKSGFEFTFQSGCAQERV